MASVGWLSCLPPSGWLCIELSTGRCPLPGVWLERGREQIDSNQECPPRFPAPRERHFAMTITIGIDPHKASHTAVAIDSFEFVLDELWIRSCSTQVTKLRDWADGFRDDRTWAVESARRARLPPCPAVDRCRRDGPRPCCADVEGPDVEFGSLAEERSERRSLGRDRRVTSGRSRRGSARRSPPHRAGSSSASSQRTATQFTAFDTPVPPTAVERRAHERTPPGPRHATQSQGPLGSTFWAAATDLVCRP